MKDMAGLLMYPDIIRIIPGLIDVLWHQVECFVDELQSTRIEGGNSIEIIEVLAGNMWVLDL